MGNIYREYLQNEINGIRYPIDIITGDYAQTQGISNYSSSSSIDDIVNYIDGIFNQYAPDFPNWKEVTAILYNNFYNAIPPSFQTILTSIFKNIVFTNGFNTGNQTIYEDGYITSTNYLGYTRTPYNTTESYSGTNNYYYFAFAYPNPGTSLNNSTRAWTPFQNGYIYRWGTTSSSEASYVYTIRKTLVSPNIIENGTFSLSGKTIKILFIEYTIEHREK